MAVFAGAIGIETRAFFLLSSIFLIQKSEACKKYGEQEATTCIRKMGNKQSFIHGGSALRSNPLVYIPFLTEKIPLSHNPFLLL